MRLAEAYPKHIIERGERYTPNVHYCIKLGDFLYAEVEGTSTYKTKVDLTTLQGDCSCPYHHNCKHAVATFLIHKQGRSINADTFINHLHNLDKQQLIDLIIKTLQNNPDLILDYELKTSTNCNTFAEGLLNDFTYKNMKKAEKLAPQFTFDHIMKIFDFLKNRDEDILTDYYESYYGDDESDPLGDFEYALTQELMNKITSEHQMKQVLTMDYLHDSIIQNAEKFTRFSSLIKPVFTKDEYLEFLLNQQNSDLQEIKETLTEENKHLLYYLPTHNIQLAEKIAHQFSDNVLHLTVAIYKENYRDIIDNKEEFNTLLTQRYFFIERKLPYIVDLFRKHKFIDEPIARLFLSNERFRLYDKKQLSYLVNKVTDCAFLQRLLDLQQSFSQNKAIFERLFHLDESLATSLLKSQDFIRGDKHWTELVEILRYLKEKFGKEYVIQIIGDHEQMFKTSSTLKSHLKDEGIFVSYIRGVFHVEIMES